MKEIRPLHELGEKRILVDDHSYDRINMYKWHFVEDMGIIHIYRKWISPIDGRMKVIRLNEEIFQGPIKRWDIDHKDGNQFNYCIDNLIKPESERVIFYNQVIRSVEERESRSRFKIREGWRSNN